MGCSRKPTRGADTRPERPEAPQDVQTDWLIIGGGIHGVHIAARLIGEAGIDGSRVRLLDPGSELLDRWRACTEVTGMTHLRSPGVHHLDLKPSSLTRFAGDRRHRPPGVLKRPYDRPALDLFNAHCQRVIERHGLRDLHIKGHAVNCQPQGEGVEVVTCSGIHIEARRVVLALGASEQPAWPDWAPRNAPRIQHVFARSFDWPADETNEPVVVVGGGISAAQVALRLTSEGRKVDLVTRHPLRVHRFDSDPGWLGPKLMPLFRREQSLEGRRRLINVARHRGSVTPEVHRALRRRMAEGQLRLSEDVVNEVRVENGGLRLSLASGLCLEAGHLLLAVGFASRRPGGVLIDRLIETAKLPCAACGYPVVDPSLRWHPRIHVTGPLAELELGPTARNIAGARRAGDRLIEGTCSPKSGRV